MYFQISEDRVTLSKNIHDVLTPGGRWLLTETVMCKPFFASTCHYWN
jgi:hypothetical protein